MMRDPKRIEPTLRALAMYWHAHPDLRLGQIVSNAATLSTEFLTPQPFYIEDDMLVAGIVELWKLEDE